MGAKKQELAFVPSIDDSMLTPIAKKMKNTKRLKTAEKYFKRALEVQPDGLMALTNLTMNYIY